MEADYRKTPETVGQLISRVEPTRLYFLLSHLTILGNRGVEPGKVFDTLMRYARDPEGSARAAAINGLGLLGTESTIAPLLGIFRGDMRLKAVPEPVRFSQDSSLDPQTTKWVCQALREITKRSLSEDPAAWVSWLAAQPTSMDQWFVVKVVQPGRIQQTHTK